MRERPTVVITGASAGVGRAVMRRFAELDGARMGLIARGAGRLESAAAEARSLGGEAIALPCDTADAAAVESAAERVEAEFGPIDVWVNCAMVTILAPFDQVSPEEFRRVTDVTYHGYVHGTMSALRRMKPRDRGVIVQVGSALAYRSIPLQAAYCGAKHAIVGFTDSIRSELIHDGSRVQICAAHLPAVNTPQFDWARSRMPRRAQPLPPIYQPEVAAEGIHFLAHNPRRELWIGRTAIMTILADKVAPGMLDHILATKAWDGQMTDEPAHPRPDNLFDPASGDWAAHGRFDARSSYSAPALKAAEHMGATAAMLAVGVGLLVAGTVAAGRRRGG